MSHPLWELRFPSLQPDPDEFDRREPVVCTVRPVWARVDSALLSEGSGFREALELLAIQVLLVP